MVADLQAFKGKSGSSCPNVGEWLEAFGDHDRVYGITITKNLSGSYNAAKQAAESYMEEHPGKQAYIFDSLSAGPELMFIAEKIRECEEKGLSFQETVGTVREFHNHLHTLFCLESMMNLARNGRVNIAVAKVAGMLGIRVVGTVQGGTIVPTQKPRGAKKATEALIGEMMARGYNGGRVRIAHCFGEENAKLFADAVHAKFPKADIYLEPTGALCSFYAEKGGLMIGYEGGFNEENDNTRF